MVFPVVLAFAAGALAATAPSFTPAASSPEATSTTYVGKNNNTLQNSPNVPGKSFDRFIQIWLENTDFDDAASSSTFQTLAKEGVLFDSYYALTHPSEPNYIAAAGGDFFGNDGDNFRAIPSNISTIVDLLEEKNISWGGYMESMPYDGCTLYNYTSANYLTPGSNYTYYMRKHNPLVIFDSISNVTERALRIRNFNDFAADVDASALPQWSFITPNMVDDAHDTTIDFASAWLEFWLVPLLKDENFNTNKTLILLTFDENENYAINNRIYTLALGNAIPTALKGTTDDTFYTHYSALSTVEANWGLGSLGRQDTNATMNNVFKWVANATGWKNNGISGNSSAMPFTNATGTIPGPLNANLYVPFTAPNLTAVGAGGGKVFVAPNLDTSFTVDKAPSPVNLTAAGATDVPWATNPGYDYPDGTQAFSTPTSTSPSSSKSSGASGSSSTGGALSNLPRGWVGVSMTSVAGFVAGALLLL